MIPRSRIALAAATSCCLLLNACQAAGPMTGPPATPLDLAAGRKGESWLALGGRLLRAGEDELALKAFERSLLAEGPSAGAMAGAGIAAERLGLITMAARYFRRARDLAPDSELANNNLGVVLFRLKEYYPARQAFQAAFALSGGRNDLALRNLRMVERVIAEIEAGRRYVDPALNMEVRRLGTYEFELVDFDPRPPDYTVGTPQTPDEDDAISADGGPGDPGTPAGI